MSVPAIGALRHRLILEEPQGADDGAGGVTVSWVTVASVWASLEAKGGRETVEAGRLAGSVSHEIRLRYRDGVKPAMRFRLDTRGFEIIGVLSDERKSLLTCLCVERDL